MSLSWPVGPEVQVKAFAGGAMLYDSSRVSNASEHWLEEGWWHTQGSVTPAAAGRGAAFYVAAEEHDYVLRHYRRGGLMARLTHARYLWRGQNATRAFTEWHLLYQLQRSGLPVPLPIAAAYRREGFTYRASLLTQRLDGVRSLAALLTEAPVPMELWVRVGRCLRRFHEGGVYHADLNAHNVLLDAEWRVWLIDFDRGRLRRPGFWCDNTLVRLRRSLEKLADALPSERFSDHDWMLLLDGYFAGDAAVAI